MRRMLSLQAFQALFASLPRIFVVVALLAAYYFAAVWAEPFVPWWVVMLTGMGLFVALLYLGSRWVEHDVLHAPSEKAREDAEPGQQDRRGEDASAQGELVTGAVRSGAPSGRKRPHRARR